MSDNATSVQDQVLSTVKSAEAAVVSAAKSIAETVEPLVNLIPAVPFSDQLPKASELIDNYFTFAEKVLANQRAFYTELSKAFTPGATRS